MPQEVPHSLISASPLRGLGLRTPLARVLSTMDGLRISYHVPLPSGERRIEGTGTLKVQTIQYSLECRVQGDGFLRSAVEYCFHSFWLTRRGRVLLALGMADTEGPGGIPLTGHYIVPVDWPRESVAAAREWMKKTRRRVVEEYSTVAN